MSDNLRILLAEDDGAMRAMLARVLERDGYEVVAVADGGELVRALAQTETGSDFDLLVTDDRMPGWTGSQVLAGLNVRSRRPVVILISAFADEPLHARATALGAAAVLDKPFDLDDFRAVVSNLLTPRTH
jgi:CheY-like chemotaxis protein